MSEHTCHNCEKSFNSVDALAMHNRSKHPEQHQEPPLTTLQKKKIRNWVIVMGILGLVVWGLISLIGGANERNVVEESNLNFEAPKGAIHWHPRLTIKIDGETYLIPANIGLSGGHRPIHTHETDGTLHLENNRPTKKTVTLGYFFEVWGQKLSKDCIFEYCTDKGTLTMAVNGKENLEFENYFMQDKDQIKIEYSSK